MAYDSVRQQIVLFGGYSGTFDDLNDTWVWDGTNWTQKLPTSNPAPRDSHGMVFDAAHGQTVMFGGSEHGADVNDTWTWDGTNWTPKSPVTSPTFRDSFGLVYDSAHSQVVLFGGAQLTEFGLNDTWVWNGTNWTQLTPATSPPGRGNLAMVYDSARSVVVMFGGESYAEEGTPLGDTWLFDGTTWTQFTAPTSPPARIYPAMAYDALHSQTLLFSGEASNNTTWLLGTLAVVPTSLPDATQGTYYSVPYSANGGLPPYSFSVSGLPAGLSVNSGNLITGVCTGSSSTSVMITVTDSATPTPSTASVGPLSLYCNPAPQITNASPLPVGVIGAAYSVAFTTNAVDSPPGAAPYTWSLSQGTLPNAFTLSSAGVLTGTSTTTGPFTFAITFTDRWGATVTKPFGLTFYPPLAITTTSLPSGAAGTPYPSTSIAVTGGSGPGTYLFSATGLPTGLTIGRDSGAINGTPTQAGSFSPTFSVIDANSQTASATIPLTVNGAASIQFTTAATLPAGRSNQAYSTTLQWTGGAAPFTVTGTGLPSWLSVSNAGVLTGTPPVGGTFSLGITVTDSQTPTHNTASRTFSLTVTAPTIATASPLPVATVGVAYSRTFAATGGTAPYTWTATALPAWLSISTEGVLSGTPPVGTTSPVAFTVQVTDSLGASISGNFSLPVAAPPSLMFVTGSPLAAGTAGTAYSATLSVSGGISPYNFSAVGLPAWLTMSSGGTVSGTPPSAGNYTFSVTVTDSASNHLSANFTIPVNAALTITTASPLSPAVVGTSFSDRFGLRAAPADTRGPPQACQAG